MVNVISEPRRGDLLAEQTITPNSLTARPRHSLKLEIWPPGGAEERVEIGLSP